MSETATTILGILRKYAWKPGNALHDEMTVGLEKQRACAEFAFKELEAGRFSRGQAELRRVQIVETGLKLNRVANEVKMLEELSALGIDREWKNNDADPLPRMLFHVRGANGGTETLDLTAEVRAEGLE